MENQTEDEKQNEQNSPKIQQKDNQETQQASSEPQEQQKSQIQTEEKQEDIDNFQSKLDVRESLYAGSYYPKNELELNIQLNCWMELAKLEIQSVKQVKGIIVPHSPFYFSGPIAAWSYKYIKNWAQNKSVQKIRVFVLGSCHHVMIRACGLTQMKYYETPLGNIEIDLETIEELKNNKEKLNFEITDKDAEEEEFSIEMQLPFLIKTLGLNNFKLIPIMVGSLDNEQEEEYGRLLSSYFQEQDTLFVTSTDFCHWGEKYQFTKFNKDDGIEIYEYIEKLDQKAMEIIESHDFDGLLTYFKESQNNICGKHALGLYVQCMYQLGLEDDLETKFIKYSQSNIVKDKKESSISFAAAISYIESEEN